MKASSRAIAATTLCFVACLLPTHLIHASSASGSSSSSKTAAAVQHTATPQQLPAATYEQGSDFEERFSREPQYLELRRGTKRLLAVRISTTYGEEPDESLAEIEGAVFGTGTNPDAIAADATVVAQYTAVSHNQVHFIPATQPEDEDAAVAAASRSSALLAVEDAINNTANNLTDGVMDVTVDTLFNGTDIHILTEFILNATRDALGGRALLEVADNYIFCLPNGSTFGSNAEWTAFTHLFEPYSYYQRSRCTRLSVVMHEIGHSFGFQHSGTVDDPYGDKTDYMGFAANALGMPRKGFNAHKHWTSGWFESRAIQVDPTVDGTVHQRLVGFTHSLDDPALSGDDAFLLRLPGKNLFLQYNRAKSYNVGTPFPDTVTITQAADTAATTPRDDVTAPTAVQEPWDETVGGSIRVAALAAGERYTYPEYTKDGYDLIVEVCSLQTLSLDDSVPDYATVSIHVANGVDRSACHQESVISPKAVCAIVAAVAVVGVLCILYIRRRRRQQHAKANANDESDCITLQRISSIPFATSVVVQHPPAVSSSSSPTAVLVKPQKPVTVDEESSTTSRSSHEDSDDNCVLAEVSVVL